LDLLRRDAGAGARSGGHRRLVSFPLEVGACPPCAIDVVLEPAVTRRRPACRPASGSRTASGRARRWRSPHVDVEDALGGGPGPYPPISGQFLVAADRKPSKSFPIVLESASVDQGQLHRSCADWRVVPVALPICSQVAPAWRARWAAVLRAEVALSTAWAAFCSSISSS